MGTPASVNTEADVFTVLGCTDASACDSGIILLLINMEVLYFPKSRDMTRDKTQTRTSVL